MIHILTVHWKTNQWIDIQLRYINKYLHHPYKVYSFLEDLPPDEKHKFFYASEESISAHSTKLNILADIATFNSDNDDDILIFIDGDAFPVQQLDNFLVGYLSKYPLIAVQRLENLGDPQPHPCFCGTTIGFWKNIKGDWNEGYKWINSEGDYVTDVGGNLLKILNEYKINWFPLHRSNKSNYHQVWFGIYSDIIYHHGAGFRIPVSRYDLKFTKYLKKYMNKKIYNKIKNNTIVKNIIYNKTSNIIRISDNIFKDIESNYFFFNQFK